MGCPVISVLPDKLSADSFCRAEDDDKQENNVKDVETAADDLEANHNAENTETDTTTDNHLAGNGDSKEEPLPNIVTEGKDFRIQIPERVYLDR